jgi:hypothetical protein
MKTGDGHDALAWKIELDDDELFGNETAEDEEESNFLAYALVRPEFEDFINAYKKVRIVRAYKGEGKSALLRWTYLSLRHIKNVAVYENFASSILPRTQHLESVDYVQEWKDALLKAAASSLGSKLELSFDDDVISLREEAERGGFRKRGFIPAVLARLKDLPGSPQSVGVVDAGRSLSRVAGANDIQVWLIIDDLDENFTDTPSDCLRVMSALVAMRQISTQVKEIWFRTSIRPSTWAIIKRKYEALSKVEPYMLDLQWSYTQLEALLASRVRAYLQRNHGLVVASGKLAELDNRALVGLAFDDPMPWGKKDSRDDVEEEAYKSRAPAVIVSTLARYRPRWMVELCKISGSKAIRQGKARIGLDQLTGDLETFGKRRIDDLIAEFRAQCEKIEVIIQSFKGKSELFKTDEIIRHLKGNLQGRDIRIAGISGRPTEVEIIRFIFQIGFITARRDIDKASYRHYSFYDEPALLSDGASDLGVTWEIPSCFRQALQLKNVPRRMPR